MMRFKMQLSFLLLLAPAIVVCDAPGQSESNKRTISLPQGASIRSVLRPSDEIVIVTDGVSGPPLEIAFPSEDAQRQYEWSALANRENTLLLVRVESVTSSLNSAETWITSTAKMRILETLSAGKSLSDGTWGDIAIDTKNAVMSITFDGGEVYLGKTLVSAGDFAVWEPNRTYLVSFRVVPEEKGVHLGVVYEVGADQNLLPQNRSRGSAMRPLSALKGRNLDDVRRLVRQF